jgi:hypothetical protein
MGVGVNMGDAKLSDYVIVSAISGEVPNKEKGTIFTFSLDWHNKWMFEDTLWYEEDNHIDSTYKAVRHTFLRAIIALSLNELKAAPSKFEYEVTALKELAESLK